MVVFYTLCPDLQLVSFQPSYEVTIMRPPRGGGTQSHYHTDFFRFNAMSGKFGFLCNIAKIGLKMGHFMKSHSKNLEKNCYDKTMK